MTCMPRLPRKRAGGSGGLPGGRGGSGCAARFRPRPPRLANPGSLRRPAPVSGAEGERAPRVHRPRRGEARSGERRPEGGGGRRPPAPRAVRFRTRSGTQAPARTGTPFRIRIRMQTRIRTRLRLSLWNWIRIWTRTARPARNGPAVRTPRPVSIRRIRPRLGGSSGCAAATPRSAGRSRSARRVLASPPRLSGAPPAPGLARRRLGLGTLAVCGGFRLARLSANRFDETLHDARLPPALSRLGGGGGRGGRGKVPDGRLGGRSRAALRGVRNHGRGRGREVVARPVVRGVAPVVGPHPLDRVVGRLLARIGNDQQLHAALLLDVPKRGPLLVEEVGRHLHRERRDDPSGVLLHRLAGEQPQHRHRERLGVANVAAAVAAWTDLVAGLAEGGPQPLPRHLEQPKREIFPS